MGHVGGEGLTVLKTWSLMMGWLPFFSWKERGRDGVNVGRWRGNTPLVTRALVGRGPLLLKALGGVGKVKWNPIGRRRFRVALVLLI